MDKLNMREYLFHGLQPFRLDRDDNDKNLSYTEIINQDIAETLSKILKTGFIYSRSQLKNILSKRDYELLVKFKKPNWNGLKYVSVTEHIDITIEKYGFIDSYNPDSAYYEFVVPNPCIILDSSILNDCARCLDNRTMLGEIQIENQIPMSYAVGIALPGIDLNSRFDIIRESFYSHDAFGLPSWYDSTKQDLLNLSEEEFVGKYYKTVILFEKILLENNSNLKLYHTKTGIPILSSSEEIEYVKQMKKRFLKK